MFIPLSTDRPPKRRPVVNQTLIVVNLVVYLIGLMGAYAGWFDQAAIARFGHFVMADFQAWQLLTYQFIHDPYSIWHIVFNLIFLWVFGNAVESRLGRIGYLGFYLIAGCVAGLAHGILNPQAPVIGASGSIAGVSGAFLALFPRARIRVLLFFFIIGVYYIPAAWFILFYFVIDLLKQTMSLFGGRGGGVAYAAHLAGYVYGFAVCFALLGLGVLKREEFDVFYLFKQGRRRRQFRASVRQAPGVWDQPKPESPDKARRKPAGAMSAQETAQAERRAEISRLLDDHKLEDAAVRYRELLDEDRSIVLPERRQLDLANQLYQEGDHQHAAQAYELLLERYGSSREADQVRLILALVYTRHQPKPKRARELLETVKPRLRSDGERNLAASLREELGAGA